MAQLVANSSQNLNKSGYSDFWVLNFFTQNRLFSLFLVSPLVRSSFHSTLLLHLSVSLNANILLIKSVIDHCVRLTTNEYFRGKTCQVIFWANLSFWSLQPGWPGHAGFAYYTCLHRLHNNSFTPKQSLAPTSYSHNTLLNQHWGWAVTI